MQLNLGKTIRELRHRDGRTQDELAEALGVTAQAVSRWESGGSYPDMELIPAIANYFHISIDELFGYHDDREKKIEEILDYASKILSHQGRSVGKGCLPTEVGECVNRLRKASEEFPNEPKILLKLAHALWLWGWNEYGAKGNFNEESGMLEEDYTYNAKNVYWQEALRTYEKVLKINPTTKDREKALKGMLPLYCSMGEFEKAKTLANNQNSLSICKEALLTSATAGTEKARYQEEYMMELLTAFDHALFDAISTRPVLFTSEYGTNLLSSMIQLYEAIFADGRFGKWHYHIGQLYLALASYEAARNETDPNTSPYYAKGFKHLKQYERISQEEEYTYSAPLLSNLNPLKKGDIAPLAKEVLAETELIKYPQEQFEFFCTSVEKMK